MPVIFNVAAAIGLMFFFLVAVAMVGGALWIFAHAFRELQFARLAALNADASRETLRASSEAVDELAGHRERLSRESGGLPSDAELRRAAFEQTAAELGLEDATLPEQYTDVEQNAMRLSPNGEADIPPDSLYDIAAERER